jgi:THO complex subunit 5
VPAKHTSKKQDISTDYAGLTFASSHAYMRLPLISEDEYLNLFPDQQDLPEQELMPRRIEHEKQEREKMEHQRLELEKVKQNLIKENARKKEELREIDEKLEVIIDGLKPLQDGLNKEL